MNASATGELLSEARGDIPAFLKSLESGAFRPTRRPKTGGKAAILELFRRYTIK